MFQPLISEYFSLRCLSRDQRRIEELHPDMPIPPDGGAFWVTDGFRSVVFDEWGDLGIVIATGSIAAGFPYQANVSEALLDKPGDLSQYFQDNFIGCQAVPAFKSRFIMPFSGPAGSNIVENLVSAPSGIAGTNPFGPLVARLAPGSDRLQVLADRSMFSNLYYPLSLGAFPATASVGGVVIMLRVDSHANVVVTGPDGRRIGVDPATGSPVNDFGDDGFDSGPGTPRFFALRNAAPGSYAVQNVATADGPFAVHVYSADQAQPVGNHIVNNHDFTLDDSGGINFLALGAASGASTSNATPHRGDRGSSNRKNRAATKAGSCSSVVLLKAETIAWAGEVSCELGFIAGRLWRWRKAAFVREGESR